VSVDRSRAFAPVSVPEAYERYMSAQIFEPWARELVRRADVQPGAAVLDVATGPGSVARIAAAAAGPDGSVVAGDISPAMLSVAGARAPEPDAAPISLLECPADRIEAADGSFDRVLCQQGFQFFPDRPAALREFHRVLRTGGSVAIAVWAAERPLGLFGPLTETIRDHGLPEPFPGAFDPGGYAISCGELVAQLTAAGLERATAATVELECRWEDGGDVARATAGTPFGPAIAALDELSRARLMGALYERLELVDGVPASFTTAANIVRGVR
jgi:SAM-dependent methyltransferase